MNALRNTLRNARNAIGAIGKLGSYLSQFLWLLFQPNAVLAARLLAAESQLAMCMRRIEQKQHPGPRFTAGFRLLWVVLSKLLSGWEQCAHLMQPATVKKWHTTAFRLFWRWKSRYRDGRPPIPQPMRELIRKLSRENPLWSAERIRDTLFLLGYEPPCEDTVRKYMVKRGNPRDKSTTWLPFLRNHLDVSWAMDFLTVTTVRFATLYVFIVLDHGRRRVIHFATTCSPSMNWVIQQLREAMPFGEQPRYMFRDNDGIYGHGVRRFLRSCGIREVRTAYRSPWQNPFIERFIGTLRRELLDHVIILSQGHLEQLLQTFIDEYYHVARPHQGLYRDTPIPQQKTPVFSEPSKLLSIPVAGGLHHRYVRVAA
jgi:transposase InsO family protein